MPVHPDAEAAHPHAILSVAVSSDGRTLVTGSECDVETDDIEARHVGVVTWDVQRGVARATIPVVGGVGLGDQLRRGLRFSADGALLGFNYSTNQVGVVDVAQGRAVLEAWFTGNDNAPSFALADDAEEIFVGGVDGFGDTIGAIAPARGGDRPQLRCVSFTGGDGGSNALSFRRGVVHAVCDEQLVSIDVRGGAPPRVMPLLGHWRAGLDAHYAIEPSPSGRHVAVGAVDPRCGRPALTGVSLIDVDSGRRVFEDASMADAVGFTFAAREPRWAALSAKRRPGHPITEITIFEGARKLGVIAGPLEVADWQRFADGAPLAFSPDGRSALLLRPRGVLERGTLEPRPSFAALATIEGAQGVLWPLPDIVIAIGPRVLAFIDAARGSIRQRHTFPR
jgi:hypothetical protein